MERELWPELYRAVRMVGKQVWQKGQRYQPWILALVYLWAAIHDRPVCWACQRENWLTTRWQPPRWPSASTLSRRVHGVAMGVFWRALQTHLQAIGQDGWLTFADGKPLPVGSCSKDRDAKRGRVQGGFAQGYKLHEILGEKAFPAAWEVTPLNAAESVVAQSLVRQLSGGGYLLGDGNYDSGPLSDAAAIQGYQLLVPCENDRAGCGHRRQSPARLRSIALAPTSFGQELLAQRIRIEQHFGHLTTFAGGLAPLPNWVRRQQRVRTWVWAKLTINAIRILKKHPANTA